MRRRAQSPGGTPSSVHTAQVVIDIKDYRSLYANLPYDLGEHFVRIRDLVCKNVPADVCTPAQCTIAIKLFPLYVNGDTKGQRTAMDRVPSSCDQAQQAAAMVAWKEALTSFERNPKITTFQLDRNELNRQFSMFHRFDPVAAEFDCSIPRPPTTFATASKDYVDLHMQSEYCWDEPDECLTKALALVGLSKEQIAAQGTQEKIGEFEFAKSGEAARPMQRSCTTDPLATFRRLENSDVEVSHWSQDSSLDSSHSLHRASRRRAQHVL
jgi:hypothetical protein